MAKSCTVSSVKMIERLENNALGATLSIALSGRFMLEHIQWVLDIETTTITLV